MHKVVACFNVSTCKMDMMNISNNMGKNGAFHFSINMQVLSCLYIIQYLEI